VDDLSAHSYCTVALIPVLLGEEFDILQEKSTEKLLHLKLKNI